MRRAKLTISGQSGWLLIPLWFVLLIAFREAATPHTGIGRPARKGVTDYPELDVTILLDGYFVSFRPPACAASWACGLSFRRIRLPRLYSMSGLRPRRRQTWLCFGGGAQCLFSAVTLFILGLVAYPSTVPSPARWCSIVRGSLDDYF
jgi:hypothetical protein